MYSIERTFKNIVPHTEILLIKLTVSCYSAHRSPSSFSPLIAETHTGTLPLHPQHQRPVHSPGRDGWGEPPPRGPHPHLGWKGQLWVRARCRQRPTCGSVTSPRPTAPPCWGSPADAALVFASASAVNTGSTLSSSAS